MCPARRASRCDCSPGRHEPRCRPVHAHGDCVSQWAVWAPGSPPRRASSPPWSRAPPTPTPSTPAPDGIRAVLRATTRTWQHGGGSCPLEPPLPPPLPHRDQVDLRLAARLPGRATRRAAAGRKTSAGACSPGPMPGTAAIGGGPTWNPAWRWPVTPPLARLSTRAAARHCRYLPPSPHAFASERVRRRPPPGPPAPLLPAPIPPQTRPRPSPAR